MTNYCTYCGGLGRIQVFVAGSENDFQRCPKCHGTGRPPTFRKKKNREFFK